MKVVLHPQADAEFLLAQQRYTDASPLLGRRFYDEITSVFSRIIEHPLRYKQFDPPARRLFANGFRYAVIYIAKPDVIWIIAVMHVRREPVSSPNKNDRD
jgi:toxin ParE1/3/4